MRVDSLRLSPSRIAEYNNCPQLYKYRVIDLLPEPPSLDAERGTLVHSVLENLFELPRLERTFAKANSLAPKFWQEQMEAKPELKQLVTSQKEWMDRVSSLLNTYFLLEDPQSFDSTHREIHLERNLNQKLYLHGYVDRIDVAPTGEVRIVDYKTGKSPKPAWESKALFQLQVYALLYMKNEGVLPRLLQLIYLGDGRVIKSVPNQEIMDGTEKIVYKISEDIFSSIESGIWPAKKSKLCNWCNFQSICPAFT